jgi:hypothetical protein
LAFVRDSISEAIFQALGHLENDRSGALSGNELGDIVKMKIVHRALLFRKRSTH